MSAAAACTERFPVEVRPETLPQKLEARPANATCLAPELPLGRVRLQPTYEGLTQPIRMIDRPDRGVIFVVELPGKVKAIDRVTGQTTVALDVMSETWQSEGQGLLGLAIHPTKPFVYATIDRVPDPNASTDKLNHADIVRFTINPDGRTFDRASEKLILGLDRPTRDHSPGTLEFGPDGYLYIGVGDGGRNIPRYITTELLAAILRIDVDGGDPYVVPPDNPYAAGGGRPEIWAGGLRNPWKFSFDRATGDLWAGDVGDARFEEVDKIERGKNYGWPTVEGTACGNPRIGCDRTGLTEPLFAYPHTEGGSVTGGYVYRGTALPDLVGKYVFGDFSIGHIWVLEGTGPSAKAVFLNPGGPKPTLGSMGEDASGELYALGWSEGTIWKLVPGEADARPVYPALLSQTGCVNPKDPKQVASGLVPYGVNVALWSDGAEKKRFLAIPDGTKLHVEDDGHLTLPNRSVVVKEFSIDDRRIETRLLFLHSSGEWSGATYEWNDAQTDATLLEVAKEKVLPNGQTWTFPSPVQCFVCHKKAAHYTLGTEVLQLNRDFEYVKGQIANQLTLLSDIGYLDKRVDPATTGRLPELAGSAPVEDRARAYLHTNCSICHRQAAGSIGGTDFRFGLPFSAIGGCTPAGIANVADVKIIYPGKPDHSALYLRMTNHDTDRMPPLGTKIVDDFAASVIEEWIRSLKSCE